MLRAYAGKATAARMTKRLVKEYGIGETELENYEDESQTQDEGPALDQRPGRPWNDQGTEAEIPRDRGQDRWDDPDRWDEEDDWNDNGE